MEKEKGRIRPDISNSEIDYLIGEWIHSERDRKILHRRFVDGVLFEPLAEEFDLSVRHVKKIVGDGATVIFSKV